MSAAPTTPKRGSRCDCGKPATIRRHEWEGCDDCDAASEETSARWKAEKKAADAAREVCQ